MRDKWLCANKKIILIYLDVELGKLDERLVQILAWQRLQQLLPQNKTATSSTNSVLSGQQKTNTTIAISIQQPDKKPVTSVTPTQPLYTSMYRSFIFQEFMMTKRSKNSTWKAGHFYVLFVVT